MEYHSLIKHITLAVALIVLAWPAGAYSPPPNCPQASGALNYSTTTNSFSCNAALISGGSCATHNFFTSLSTTGAVSCSQPACGDLSNAAASCSTDTTNASNISSGTLNTARLPSPFTNGTASGNTSTFGTTSGTLTSGDCVKFDASGNLIDSGAACGAGGGGTVTSFSAGNLSPLFTTSVATATTTPALSFALTNQNANIVYAGPSSGSAAAPTFRSLVFADLPAFDMEADASFARSMQEGSMNTPDQESLPGYVGRTWKNQKWTGLNNFTGTFQIGGTSETFPASGLIVGTSDTQTLTNKSIAGSEINSGTVGSSFGGAGAVTGALKANGSGVVSQAACADLSNGGTACAANTGTSGANVPLLNGTNTWGATQTFPGNSLTLGELATIGANTMLGNWSGSTGNVAAQSMPSCADSGGNHLNYVAGTGITCGTSQGTNVTSFTGDGTLISNSASTGAVTATLASQSKNTVLAGPASGSNATPTFRALVYADVPAYIRTTATGYSMSNFGGL